MVVFKGVFEGGERGRLVAFFEVVVVFRFGIGILDSVGAEDGGCGGCAEGDAGMVGLEGRKGKGGASYVLLVYGSLVAEGDEKWKVQG